MFFVSLFHFLILPYAGIVIGAFVFGLNSPVELPPLKD